MPEYIGNVSAVQNEFEYDTDPLRGPSYTYSFSGSQASITAAAEAWRVAGARVAMTNTGALWHLKVNLAVIQGGVEIPVDVWETHTDNGNEDFYASYKVWLLVANQYGVNDAEYYLTVIRKEIEDAISQGVPLDTAVIRVNDITTALYKERARGTDSTEIKRPVLRRVRYVSAAYASPTVVEAIPRVWTTDALIRDYSIPNAIRIKLPTTPAFTPSNSGWGWKKREEDSRFHSPINKFEETDTWYFAAWSTLRYDFVT